MVHNCKLCTYFTKSSFSIENHMKHHHNGKSLKLFDCTTNTPEPFVCSECNFSTQFTTDFKHHLRTHNIHMRNKEKYDCKFYNFKVSTWYKSKTSQCPLTPTLRIYICLKHIPEEFFATNDLDTQLEGFQNRTKKSIVSPKNILEKSKKKNNESAKYRTVRKDGEEWYECAYCLFKTFNRKSFHCHYSRFHRKKPEELQIYSCEKCTFKTRHKYNLKNHILCKHASDKDVKWYTCQVCPYKCKFRGLLNSHMINKHKFSESIKSFQHGFKNGVKNSVVAKRSRIENKLTQCEKCSFRSKYYRVELHMRRMHTHEKERTKWFECNLCPFKSKLQKRLNNHISRMHTSGKDSQWYPCKMCLFKFKTRNTLRMHMFHTHQVYDNLFKLQKPKRPNEQVKQVKKETISKKSRIVHCEFCPFKTMLLSTLQTHMGRYHKDKLDSIDDNQISEEIKRLDKLKIALNFRKQSKEIRWLSCEQCMFKTKKIYHLDRHKLVHIEGKDKEFFACEKCSFATTDKVVFINHSNLHTGDLFFCVYCTFTTWYRSSLDRHVTKRHLNAQNCTLEKISHVLM